MVTLYGNNFSFNSNKVRFAANAMNVDYEFKSVDLAKGEQRQEAFLKVNPVGRIPALSDGDFVVFESNSIMRYLAEKTNSTLYPKDLKAHTIVNQWLDFGSLHVGVAMSKIFFNTLVYQMVNAKKDEVSLSEGRLFLSNFLKIIENQLAKSPYLSGQELTLADLNLLAILDPCEATSTDISMYPKVVAWRKKLQAQAYYQKVYTSFADYLGQAMAKRT